MARLFVERLQRPLKFEILSPGNAFGVEFFESRKSA